MDREKVKKELLELNAKAYGLWVHDQKNEFLAQIGNITDDVLTMLNEQEAVVHPEPSCEMTYITDCCCDLCGVQLIREDNFCRCCGKRIEWQVG